MAHKKTNQQSQRGTKFVSNDDVSKCGGFQKCHQNAININIAEDVFGKDIFVLKGKTTR